MIEQDGIPRLRELTKKLSAEPGPCGGPYYEYGDPDYPAIMTAALMKKEGVAVARAFFPEGSFMPPHQHGVKEWIICISGELEFRTTLGDRRIFRTGDWEFLDVGTGHSIRAISNSEVIAITVPADPEFPDVPPRY